MDFDKIAKTVAEIQRINEEIKRYWNYLKNTSETGTVWIPKYEGGEGIHVDKCLLRPVVEMEINRRVEEVEALKKQLTQPVCPLGVK